MEEPMRKAILGNDINAVRSLMNEIDLNAWFKDDGTLGLKNAPLHLAVQKSSKEIVCLLLRKKAKANLFDSERNTPLHLAVENKLEEMVKLLLQFKADLFFPNKAGKIPLDLAIDSGAVNIVEIMFEHTKNNKTLTKSNKKHLEEAFEMIDKKYKNDDIKWKTIYDIKEEIVGKSNRSEPNEKGRYSCKSIAEGTSLHGYLFQSRLMSLVVKKALDLNYKFSLATEMDAALPFDDISIKYNDIKNSDCNFWLLQAKHRFQRSVLPVDSLWTEGNKFCILKYFIGYCQIMKKNPFKGNETRINFVFITNTNINIDIKINKEKVWNKYLVRKTLNEDDDKFLFIQGEGITCLTLNNNETYREKIETEIKTMIKQYSERIAKNKDKANDRKTCEELKNENIFGQKFEHFRKNLKIITNYPNVHELDKLIEQELGKKFPRQNLDFLNGSIQNRMNNYLITCDSDSKRQYFKHSEANTLFKSFVKFE